MDRIRILIADDHPVFRFGLNALLRANTECEVVGEATTGHEAVAMASELLPDVILMDINMPGINGIDATREIMSLAPDTGILVITMFDDDSVFAAMRAGARGYLLKGAEGEEMLRAIHAVANGEAIFSPSIATRLLAWFSTPEHSEPIAPFPELTIREREVLGFIAAGMTNASIADRLFISPKTVRNNVSTIFAKLQVTSRAEAIIRAREAGMGNE